MTLHQPVQRCEIEDASRARHNTENIQVLKHPRRRGSAEHKLDAFEQAAIFFSPRVSGILN